MHESSVSRFLVWCAVAFFLAACTDEPHGPALPKFHTMQLVEAGSLDEVKDLLMKARERVEPGGTNDRALMIRLQAFSRSDPQWTPRLEEWVENSPDSWLAHLALGLHYRHISFKLRDRDVIRHTNEQSLAGMRDFAALAANHYREAARLDPENPIAWAFLANLPSSIRPPDMTWDKLLDARAPLSESAWYLALNKALPKWGGSIVQIMNRLQLLEQRIETNPKLARLRGFEQYAIADRHYWDDHYEAALTSCKRAIDAGNHPEYRRMCAFALHKLDRHEEALEMIDLALEQSPEDADFLRQRARSLDALGRIDQAIEVMNRVLEYQPYDPSALRHMIYYLAEQNQLDEAFELLERARVYGDADDETHDLAARLYYDAGRYDESAESARIALKLSRNRSLPYIRLANAYNKLSDCANLHATLNDFLASCARLNDCSRSNMKWAEQTLQTVKTHPACAAWREQVENTEP